MSLKLMVPTLPANPKAYLEQYKAAATKALATGKATGGFPAQVEQWIQRIDQFAAITEKNHLAACSASPQEHVEKVYAARDGFNFVHGSVMIGAAAALEHQRAIVGASATPAETDRLSRLHQSIGRANTRHFALINMERVSPWASIH